MDRDKVIELCNSLNTGNLSIVSASELLTKYCIEYGKDRALTIKFVSILLNTPFCTDCILIALDYYKKKFNITEVKKNNEVLLIY